MKDKVSNPFRIFQSRDYSLYFGGQLISQVGTWMQQIALSWLTYKLTASPLLLTVVGVSSQLPSLVLMPFAGVLADRFNRHTLVLVAQVVAMLEASTLAYLTITNQVQVWHLIALGLVMGMVNALDLPVRSAFVVDMVDDQKDLPAAIAMNSSLMNVSRLFGPALAGFFVAMFGEGVCFAINAASYVAVIVALLLIKGIFAPKKQTGQKSVLAEFKEGIKYVMRTSPIRAPILLLATFGFGGMAYILLMPVFVKDIGGDANTLGYLSSASAAGSVCATIVLGMRNKVIGLGRWIVVSSFVYAAALVAFATVHNFWVALPVLAVIGFAMMIQIGSCNMILQSVVDNDKRGRVMSLFTMAFMGSAPLGSLVAGSLADRFGFHITVLICGIYCLVVATAFALTMPKLRREARPLFIQRGLLEADEEVDILTKPAA
jgi:MFS family permease